MATTAKAGRKFTDGIAIHACQCRRRRRAAVIVNFISMATRPSSRPAPTRPIRRSKARLLRRRG